MGEIFYLYPQQMKTMTEQELRNAVENKCQTLNKENPSEMAEFILDLMGREFPFPVAKLARALGFTVEVQTIDNEKLSGYIACDDSLPSSTRLIRVNARDSLGHQRFTIAHELWHYFESYPDIQRRAANGGFYSSYRTDLADLPTEQKANTFAADLLMPMSEYATSYEMLKAAMPEREVIDKMTVIFGVSNTAISKRNKTLLSTGAHA